MAARIESDPKRRKAEVRGRRAETVAAWYLRLKLYRVLARRYRTPVGEIDLIARRGKTIVFVEVKERANDAAIFEAVTPASRKRIARAAELWLTSHPGAAGFNQRFDVIFATPGRLPRHLVSAFDHRGNAW
jgi:putative endonuclease